MSYAIEDRIVILFSQYSELDTYKELIYSTEIHDFTIYLKDDKYNSLISNFNARYVKTVGGRAESLLNRVRSNSPLLHDNSSIRVYKANKVYKLNQKAKDRLKDYFTVALLLSSCPKPDFIIPLYLLDNEHSVSLLVSLSMKKARTLIFRNEELCSLLDNEPTVRFLLQSNTEIHASDYIDLNALPTICNDEQSVTGPNEDLYNLLENYQYIQGFYADSIKHLLQPITINSAGYLVSFETDKYAYPRIRNLTGLKYTSSLPRISKNKLLREQILMNWHELDDLSLIDTMLYSPGFLFSTNDEIFIQQLNRIIDIENAVLNPNGRLHGKVLQCDLLDINLKAIISKETLLEHLDMITKLFELAFMQMRVLKQGGSVALNTRFRLVLLPHSTVEYAGYPMQGENRFYTDNQVVEIIFNNVNDNKNQSEFVGQCNIKSTLGTLKFTINRDQNDNPVTVLISDTPSTEKESPEYAVDILREFLKKELE